MKTIFFIDGENFVYQLRDTLAKRRLIKYRDELARVDIRKLFVDAMQDPSVQQASIRYYAAKVHIIDRTPELKERTERYAADAEVWKKALTDQGIEYVDAGHLLVRDGKPCVECGHREPVLTEKGVDVQLATDVIRSSGENVRLVLFSSDGDLMPAVEESKRRGSELVYIGFRGVSNAALSRIASKRLTITGKVAGAALRPKPNIPAKVETGKPDQKQAQKPVQKPIHKPDHNQAPKLNQSSLSPAQPDIKNNPDHSHTSGNRQSSSRSRQARPARSQNQASNSQPDRPAKPQNQTNQPRPTINPKPSGFTTGSRLAGMLAPQPQPKNRDKDMRHGR